MHEIITATLVYLSIGSSIWVVLDRLGVVKQAYDAAVARGERRTTVGTVMATLFVILGWWIFVAIWLRGMARAR